MGVDRARVDGKEESGKQCGSAEAKPVEEVPHEGDRGEQRGGAIPQGQSQADREREGADEEEDAEFRNRATDAGWVFDLLHECPTHPPVRAQQEQADAQRSERVSRFQENEYSQEGERESCGDAETLPAQQVEAGILAVQAIAGLLRVLGGAAIAHGREWDLK